VPLQRYSKRGSKEGLSIVGKCKLFEFALQRCLILVLHALRSEIVLELTNMFNCNDFNGYDLTGYEIMMTQLEADDLCVTQGGKL
jgi:hypothetical protein